MHEFASMAQVWHKEAAVRVRQALGDVAFQRLAEMGAAMPIFEITRYAEGEIRAALMSSSSENQGEGQGPSS